MKFDILSRFTGAVQITAEIECSENELTSVKLGLAVKWAIKSGANLGGADLGRANLGGAYLSRANLGGADLSGADLSRANLGGANLGGANLGRAYLSRAYLGGADLGGADLSRANLSRADLGGADLGGAYLGEQWIIQGATRSDGYAFFLQKLKGDSEPMIKAGCRYFTLAQAESHWTATRGKTPLGRETEAIVRSMVSIAHIRGLMTEAKAVAA